MTEDFSRELVDGPNAEASNDDGIGEPANTAMISGGAGQEMAGQAEVAVFKPAAGETQTIQAESGVHYALQFPPDTTEAAIDAGNLILLFADGSRIVFEDIVNLAESGLDTQVTVAGNDVLAGLIGQPTLTGVPIDRPGPGETVSHDPQLGETLIIRFDPSAADVTVEGNNLVLTFGDGGRVVLLGGADPGLAQPGAPLLDIGGNLFSLPVIAATARGDAGQGGPQTLLETAAPEVEAAGSGGPGIQEPTLEVINLIDDTPVIPPTELQFRLIDLEPEDLLDDEEPQANDDGPFTNPDGTVINEAAGQVGIFPFFNEVFFRDAPGTELALEALDTVENPDFTPLSVSGNVLPNDSFGADGQGSPPITDFTYLGGLGAATTTVGANSVVVTSVETGQDGLPVWQVELITSGPDAGTYTFTQNDNYLHDPVQGPNVADGDFSYTIQDAQGQDSSAVLTLRIVDDVPQVVSFEAAVTIDETPGNQEGTDDTQFGSEGDSLFFQTGRSFAFATVDPGADGIDQLDETDIVDENDPFFGIDLYSGELTTADGARFTGEDSGLDTTDGNSIFLFSVDFRFGLGTIVGIEGATKAEAEAAFELFLSGDDGPDIEQIALVVQLSPFSGEILFGITEAIAHPDSSDPNDAVSISETIFFSVKDNDGDVATSSSPLILTVLDDGPRIELKTVDQNEGFEGGETFGQTMVYEEDLVPFFEPPRLVEDVQNDGPPQEESRATGQVGINFDFGTDGAAAEGMGFTIALKSATDGDDGGPLPTGLQTSADDLPVNTFYDAEAKTLIGFTGDDPTDTESWVFDLKLIDFMDNSMATAFFTLHQAIEHPDVDGNSEVGEFDPIDLNFTITATDGDNDTATVGVVFTVKDDGPGRGFEIGFGLATVDEDGLVSDGDTNKFSDPDFDTDENILTATGGIGFLGNAFGADGPGEGSGLSFAPQSAPPGLTSRGDPVDYVISDDGQTLTALAAAERTVFTVELDLANNQYNLVLADVIDHDTNRGGELFSFAMRLVDGDGDFIVLDEALTIQIKNAEPIAASDVDTVEEGTATAGNVITGIDPDSDPNNLQADTQGADDAIKITSVVFEGPSVPTSGALTEAGGLKITTFNGTLTIFENGDYSYAASANAETQQDVFVYLLTDFDGDSRKASLTINLTDIPSPSSVSLLHDETAGLQFDGSGANTEGATDDDDSDEAPNSALLALVAEKLGLPDGELPEVPIGQNSELLSLNVGVNGLAEVRFDTASLDIAGNAASDGTPLVTLFADDTLIILGVPGSELPVLSLHLIDTGIDADSIPDSAVVIQYAGLAHPTAGDGTIPAGSHDESLAQQLTVDYVVKNTNGVERSALLSVDIEDDGPRATNNEPEVDTLPVNRNIVLVFDRSGSMDEDPQVNGVSERIDLARAAVASLLAAAADSGEVNVMIVDFAADVADSGWLTGTNTEVLTAVNNYLAALQPIGNTNYSLAAQQVIDRFDVTGNELPTLPAGEVNENLLYWLSDGEITEGGDPFSTIPVWGTFLQGPDVNMEAIAVGIGEDIGDLSQVAEPGDPIIVQDESKLIETLLETLPVGGTGNVLTDDDKGLGPDSFGTDGPGQILSIVVDTDIENDVDGFTTFTYNVSTNQIINGDTLASIVGPEITGIETELGGLLDFNFASGAYSYTGDTEVGGTEEITYTIIDADGDSSEALVTIVIPAGEGITGLPLEAGTNGDDDDLSASPNTQTILGGDDGDDNLFGDDGDDLLFGGDGADVLDGGAGNDVLVGGNADTFDRSRDLGDILRGGAGDDFLVGGPGGDTFDYDAPSVVGDDVIADFQNGVDIIDLDGLLDSQGVDDSARNSGPGGDINIVNGVIVNGVSASVVTIDGANFSDFSITVQGVDLNDTDFNYGTLVAPP